MSDAVVANRRGWLILAADLVLFFLLLRWLPFSPVENRGLALLVFVGVLWLTEAFHITVTSLMIPLFAIGLGVLSTKAAFAPFAEPVIFMFFGGFVIAAVLHIQKLDLWIAGHVIRLAGGSLKLTIFYLFAVTAFLSLFVNNTAVAAMMLPLTLGILRQVDVEKNRKLYAFVLLGIAFSASIGGIGTLVGSTPNALLATMIDISFADWLKYGMPVVALMMPAMVLSLWVVLRPDFSVPFNVDIEDIPLDGRRMFTLVVFAATAVLLILGKLVVGPLQQLLALPEPIKNI
ncbi:MAG: SLC13 family permease, partial [Lautropia mirabilis]